MPAGNPSQRGRAAAWLLSAVVAAGAAGALAWWLWRPVAVSTVMPERGPAVRAVYATGTVEPTVMMPIAPRVAGRIESLKVDEGDIVSQGQVLAQLDDTDLERTVDELEARAKFAEEQYRRTETMFQRGVGSAADRDRARADWRAADAAAARARALREFMWLTAPADGQILRRDGEVGQLIPVNQPVFYLSCCAGLRISAAVDEEDIALVKPGQPVLVRADAFANRTFEGAVTDITPMGDPVTRTYRVRISLPTDVPLRIGMTADTNIIVERHEDALLIPTAALRDGTVWVVRDARARLTPVKTGIEGALRTEVLEGLSTEDRVIAAPGIELQDGARVRVVPAGPRS